MDEEAMGNTPVHKFGLLQCPSLVPSTKTLHLCGSCFSELQPCYGISSKENTNLGFIEYSDKALCPNNLF